LILELSVCSNESSGCAQCQGIKYITSISEELAVFFRMSSVSLKQHGHGAFKSEHYDNLKSILFFVGSNYAAYTAVG
jgi:hypothetical protein